MEIIESSGEILKSLSGKPKESEELLKLLSEEPKVVDLFSEEPKLDGFKFIVTEKSHEECMKEIYDRIFDFSKSPTDGLPDICKDCDVFNYGMPSEYCNDCDGPKYFFYGDDD